MCTFFSFSTVPQVTEVLSNTSMRLGDKVPEDYVGVSCCSSWFPRVVWASFLFTRLGPVVCLSLLQQGSWGCDKALRDAPLK